ncbi:MAG: hypothetical protein PHV51_02725 [Methanosarcinaceae archaeon]|nr:hypothetical protein [Methanosarcinaceae archaeon]
MYEVNYGDIEWEVLQEPIIIDDINPNKNIPKKPISIEIQRDDSYQIRAKLRAIYQNNYNDHLKEEIPGSVLEFFTIEGCDHKGSKIELKNCLINKSTITHSYLELEIITNELKINRDTDSETSWLAEWYLNGPNRITFPQNTIREMDKVSRQRITVDISVEDAVDLCENLPKMNKDFMFINTELTKFIIAKVPDTFGPDWSENICIEYNKQFGEIPDFEQREAISEIVSFVLGRQLLFVGLTKYDHNGQKLESLAKSSWGKTYSRFVYQSRQDSPFNFDYRSFVDNERKIEDILCDLVPKYLVSRNDLNLRDALWSYWISRTMPIGTNLPVLSSALEIIMKAWFKSQNSENKAVYMPNKEFKYLLKEEFQNIERKLDGFDFKNIILNKLYYSNQMSGNKKYELFFEEIGLKTGSIEKRAMKARNSMAHGDKGNDKLIEMIKSTYAYETLFHRVFLKVLGYEGNYVDRSTIGYPEKHIDLPLGESE